jgi:hypothetical protein
MTDNRIDISITPAQVDSVLAALKTIEETIPGLIEQTPDQRKAMAHYSDKDLGYILKALSVAEQHPETLPPSFNLDEMRHDVDALQKLDVIVRALTRINGVYQDSLFAAGSESLGHERSIYQFVKTHNKLTGKLEDILAELSQHYARNKPAAKPDTPAAP